MEPKNPAEASPVNTRTVPLHDEIARRAREIWQANGQPTGRDEEFWLKAELEVLGASDNVRLEGAGAVSAQQYEASTDANAAKQKSGARRSSRKAS